MKVRRWHYRLAALAVTLGILLGMAPIGPALAAGGVATINVSGGVVKIYPDGYTIGENKKVPHTGAYLLRGSGNQEVYFHANGGKTAYDVTVQNLKLKVGMWKSAFGIESGTTLNLTVQEDNTILGYNHPGIMLFGTGDHLAASVAVTMAGDSRLTLGNQMEGTDISASQGIQITLTDETGVSGLGNLANKGETLTLGKGKLHTHEYAWQSDVDGHMGICNICGQDTPKSAHEFVYNVTQNGHVQVCVVCAMVKAEQAHTMTDWDCKDEAQHIRHCSAGCGYEELQDHNWGEGVFVPGDEDSLPAYNHTCRECAAVRTTEEDTANAMAVMLGEGYGDTWNGAGLIVYRDGVKWKTLGIDSHDVEEKTVYLPYKAGRCYAFQWQQGEYDEECKVAVTLPGEANPVFEQEDFSNVKQNEIVFALNLADYTAVDAAVAAIPAGLQYYTIESVTALMEQVYAVNRLLGTAQQEQVNGYAAAITAATAALVPQTEANGYLDLADGDVYITEDGYRRTLDGAHTPHTGAYMLVGSTDQYRVKVESGTHEITLWNLFVEQDATSPIQIDPGAAVQMKLVGDSVLNSYEDEKAGLNVPEGAALHMLKQSTGSLYVKGLWGAAGIGGNADEGAGEITIDGGQITALGLEGSGIGGGFNGAAGKIVINGGKIHAECLDSGGAGIGAGEGGQGGSITINGGFLTVGSDKGAAIGSGIDNSKCDKIVINDGVIVIHSSHNNPVIIGNVDDPDEEAENTVEINGGNIISDVYNLAAGVQPAPKNARGELVVPYKITVPEELENKRVLLTLPDGGQTLVTAYGVRIVTFLPRGLDVETISVSSGDADYSAVEAALAKVPDDLSLYTQESVGVLQVAIDEIVWGLDATRQAEVDAMAQAVEDALAGLEKKQAESSKPPTGDPAAGHPDEDSNGNPTTGDPGSVTVAVLLAVSVSGLVTLYLNNKKKKIK